MSQSLRAGSRTGSPSSHQPDMSETKPLPALELLLRNIIQSDRLAGFIAQLAQPPSGIYFVKDWEHSELKKSKDSGELLARQIQSFGAVRRADNCHQSDWSPRSIGEALSFG